MKPRRKTSYAARLGEAQGAHPEFLLGRLQEEWDEIQRTAKREVLIKRAKEIAWGIGKTLLILAAVGGVLTVGAVAPKAIAVIGQMTGRRGFFDAGEFRKASRYLKRRKLITVEKNGERFIFKLTGSGLKRVLKMSYEKLGLKKPRKWDGLWRLVIFDMPVRKKWERDGFRGKLKRLGFHQLQQSVFVMPYPCRDEVEYLASLFSIRPYVRFIETPMLSDDDDLQQRFHL